MSAPSTLEISLGGPAGPPILDSDSCLLRAFRIKPSSPGLFLHVFRNLRCFSFFFLRVLGLCAVTR